MCCIGIIYIVLKENDSLNFAFIIYAGGKLVLF